MMSAPYSKMAMFSPISPSPPRGMNLRPGLSFCAVSSMEICLSRLLLWRGLGLGFHQCGNPAVASGNPFPAGGGEPPHGKIRAAQGPVGDEGPRRVPDPLKPLAD